jgi:hypothetical protein
VKLPAEKPTKTKAPTLPDATRYSKSTRDWWTTVWRSPMATAWLEADVPALVRLATLNELLEQGEATAMVLAEIRQLEDRFGLSPLARRRLQWEVEHAGGEPKPVAAQKGRWLRAVSE